MPVTNEQIQVVIEHILRLNYAVKNVDLALKVMSYLHPALFDTKQYLMVLQTLVDNGDVIEIEFVTSEVDYRVKSIYFPKGTKFNSSVLHVDINWTEKELE